MTTLRGVLKTPKEEGIDVIVQPPTNASPLISRAVNSVEAEKR